VGLFAFKLLHWQYVTRLEENSVVLKTSRRPGFLGVDGDKGGCGCFETKFKRLKQVGINISSLARTLTEEERSK
jgi:hypothetical protein